MRVTSSEVYRNYLSNLETLNSGLSDINQQLSTGKKINDLADSPAGSAELVALTDLESDLDTYRSNTNAGTLALSVSDSTLNQLNNLFASVYTKGSSATVETLSDAERGAIAADIRGLRDQMLSFANTEANGRPLFAGSRTTSNPFVLQPDGVTVTYAGDADVNSVVVSEGLDVMQGVAGSEFLSVFTTVHDLLVSLDANDVDGVKSALAGFDDSLAQLGQARAKIGANLAVLENVKTNLASRETNLKGQRTSIEGANQTEVIVRLSQMQKAQDAAISAGGLILKQSNLFDILG